MEVIIPERFDVLVALLSHIAHPLKNILDGTYCLSKGFSATPFCSEYVVSRGYDGLRKALEKLPDVRAFPVGDMTHMPKNTVGFWVGLPEELLLRQSTDFVKRIYVPKPFSTDPIEETRYPFPFRHEFTVPCVGS